MCETLREPVKVLKSLSEKTTNKEYKFKITHSQDKARFLGYDITTAKNSALMYDSKHQLRKTHTGRIKLYAPRDKWQAKLIEYGALRIRYDENGKL